MLNLSIMHAVPVLVGVGTGIVWFSANEIYNHTHPTLSETLKSRGYEYSPILVDLKKQNLKSEINFESGKCFQTFFPGAQIKHEENKGEREYNSESINTTRLDISTSGLPVGCSIMQAYVESGDKFTFNAEITAKGENIGWALWIGWKRLGANSQNIKLKQNLIFLEKKDNSWSPVGGYSWSEQPIIESKEKNPKIKNALISISGDKWLHKDSDIDIGSGNHKQYTGIWEVDSHSSKEIFQDIELDWGTYDLPKKHNFAKILGRNYKDGKVNFEPHKKHPNQNRSRYIYDKVNGWFKYKHEDKKDWEGVDPSLILNVLYSPFRNRFGTWKTLNGYCENKQYKRRWTKEGLDLAKDFCYKKIDQGPALKTVPAA